MLNNAKRAAFFQFGLFILICFIIQCKQKETQKSEVSVTLDNIKPNEEHSHHVDISNLTKAKNFNLENYKASIEKIDEVLPNAQVEFIESTMNIFGQVMLEYPLGASNPSFPIKPPDFRFYLMDARFHLKALFGSVAQQKSQKKEFVIERAFELTMAVSQRLASNQPSSAKRPYLKAVLSCGLHVSQEYLEYICSTELDSSTVDEKRENGSWVHLAGSEVVKNTLRSSYRPHTGFKLKFKVELDSSSAIEEGGTVYPIFF